VAGSDQCAKCHDLEFLTDLVIKDDLRAACRANITFEAYWLTLRDCSCAEPAVWFTAVAPRWGRRGAALDAMA